MRSRRLPTFLIVLACLSALAILPAGAGAGYPTASDEGRMTNDELPSSLVIRPSSSVLQTPIAPHVTPGDWPMYGHDVSRTNFNSDETTINAGNLNQLVQRWQGNIRNGNVTSSSGPSVAGGKVFVGSSAPSGNNNFFAFDAVGGGQLWGANLHTISCLGVGIGSTAAISGTMVVVGGGDQAFYGLNTESGEIVWRHAINLGNSGFPWSSPLLAYDQAYLGLASCADNPSVRGELRLTNISDGTPTVSQYFVPQGRGGAGVWNSAAMSPDGSIVAVATGEDYGGYNGPYNRAIVAMDAFTLEILGADQRGQTGVDQDFGTTPVIFHDNQGRLMVGANHKNGTFYAYLLNNVSAGPLWQRATGTRVGMMPAYDPTLGDGGTLFITGGTRLYAVDPATGIDRWTPVTVGTMQGNLAIANRLIFANTGSSGLKILDETNGALLRTLVPPSPGSSNAGVSVSNGFIYWTSGTYLNAWSLPANPDATNTPVPTNTPTFTPTRTPQSATSTPTNTPTSPAGTVTPCPIIFTDVSPSDYFYEAVRYLYCAGVISGYADNTFRPYNNTTRGQLSKIIVLAEGWSESCPKTGHFSDVPFDHIFYCYVETAYEHNIISGYGDGTFRPDNNVTRAQLCKIVVLAEEWPIDTSGGPHFSDVPESDAFYTFIETAYNREIISGYSDGTFRPYNNTTRGQISKIVYSAITAP